MLWIYLLKTKWGASTHFFFKSMIMSHISYIYNGQWIDTPLRVAQGILLEWKFYAYLSSIFFIRRHVVCLNSWKATWGSYTPSSYTHSNPNPTCFHHHPYKLMSFPSKDWVFKHVRKFCSSIYSDHPFWKFSSIWWILLIGWKWGLWICGQVRCMGFVFESFF